MVVSVCLFFFSSRRRHTRCALVTGVQTCALPIWQLAEGARRLLAEADELEARVKLGAQTISGPIRFSAPEDLGRRRIVPVIDAFLDEHAEIGRASCRERVCQYVSISVVAVSLKKKHTYDNKMRPKKTTTQN